MTSFSSVLGKFAYDILIIFAKLPFLVFFNSFVALNDMGEFALAEHRLDQEKDRGTVFVVSDNNYTKIN
jgi:hypothetical protein